MGDMEVIAFFAGTFPDCLDFLGQSLDAAPISWVATPLIASTPRAANLLGVARRRSPRLRVLPITQYRSGDMEPNLSGLHYVLPFPWFVRLTPVQQSSSCDVWNLWEAQSSSLIYYLLITIDV